MPIAPSHGSVAALWRFPVKSMAGESLEEALFDPNGLVGDRAFGLIDAETGAVVTASEVKRFPQLVNCRAAFVEPPGEGRVLPPVRITLTVGRSIDSDAGNVDRVLSEHFGREVTLTRTAPPTYTLNQTAFLAKLAVSPPVPPGSLLDLYPVSVLTTSTIGRLGSLRPQSRFDLRRFRMNVIVTTVGDGFVENAWVGHTLAASGGARFTVALPDPRCVMTTVAQGDPSPCGGRLPSSECGAIASLGDLLPLPCGQPWLVASPITPKSSPPPPSRRSPLR